MWKTQIPFSNEIIPLKNQIDSVFTIRIDDLEVNSVIPDQSVSEINSISPNIELPELEPFDNIREYLRTNVGLNREQYSQTITIFEKFIRA